MINSLRSMSRLSMPWRWAFLQWTVFEPSFRFCVSKKRCNSFVWRCDTKFERLTVWMFSVIAAMDGSAWTRASCPRWWNDLRVYMYVTIYEYVDRDPENIVFSAPDRNNRHVDYNSESMWLWCVHVLWAQTFPWRATHSVWYSSRHIQHASFSLRPLRPWMPISTRWLMGISDTIDDCHCMMKSRKQKG